MGSWNSTSRSTLTQALYRASHVANLLPFTDPSDDAKPQRCTTEVVYLPQHEQKVKPAILIPRTASTADSLSMPPGVAYAAANVVGGSVMAKIDLGPELSLIEFGKGYPIRRHSPRLRDRTMRGKEVKLHD